LRRPSFFSVSTRPTLLIGSKVRLRPKRLQDAANDYGWRRDVELCRLDAATPILCSFEEFLESYIEELYRASRSYRFAIETLDGRHIGNFSYFNIDETKNEAEMGIMIGDRAYWNCGYGSDAILTSLNPQKCFQKCGFTTCGHLTHGDHYFILMEIHRPVKLKPSL